MINRTLTAALFLSAIPAVTRADAEAAREFDTLFGESVRQVLATQDAADDVALAGKLLVAAKTATDKLPLMAVMLEKAYDLSARDTAGTATAIDAMETLADQLPDRRVAATQKILNLLQRDYLRAKPADLAAPGGALIDKLIELGEARAAASDFSGAASEYAKALPVAVRIKSDQEPVIKARIAALMHRQRIENQIALLQERVLKDRTDKNAANELAILYLGELDRPSAAQQYLDAMTDDDLKKYTPVAAKDVSELAATELMPIATWYEALSKRVGSVPAKKNTLGRAEKYLESFIEMQTDGEQNLVKLQAELALKRVQTMLASLSPQTTKETPEKLFTFTGRPLAIEAEKAQVIAEPMKIEKTGSASGGAYVWKPGVIGQRVMDGPGHVVFHVKTAEAVDVYLWGHVRSLGGEANSFYIAVAPGKVTSGGNKRDWNLPDDTRNWVWAAVSERPRRERGQGGGRFGPPQREPDPITLRLEAGVNSIMVFPREAGAQLDGIYLSKTNEKPK